MHLPPTLLILLLLTLTHAIPIPAAYNQDPLAILSRREIATLEPTDIAAIRARDLTALEAHRADALERRDPRLPAIVRGIEAVKAAEEKCLGFCPPVRREESGEI